jgi:hypothetical protein
MGATAAKLWSAYGRFIQDRDYLPKALQLTEIGAGWVLENRKVKLGQDGE